MIKPNNSIISLKIWYNVMSSFLLQNTLIPIQLTLHHRSHVPSQSFSKAVVLTIAVKDLGMLQHTNPLFHWIEVYTERLLFSLAVKMPNFWGPKIDKKVINSSTKCLISVKIAVFTPHIISPPLVNVWLIFNKQKHVNWLCVFLEVNPCFQKVHIFCMDLQPASCRSIQGSMRWSV